MEFRQIEAFVNVVKHKSFSKAADASFLTQPTISMHISSLEKELGVLLLERRKKEVLPTSEGKQFYNYALNMINTRAKATHTIMNMRKNPSGIIELQSSTVPAQVFLPDILSEFNRKHSEIKFYLEQSDSIQVIENLLQGKGELGFVGKKSNTAGVIYEEIFEDEDVLITSATSRVSHISGDTVSVEDFIKEPFILRESGSGTGKNFEEELEKYGHKYKAINIVARTNSTGTIISTVASGLGVSIISKKVALLNKGNDSIKMFSITEFQEKRTFYMVYGKNIVLTPAAEALKNFILDSR